MSRNDITGDEQKTRPNSKEFRENFGKIFGEGSAERGTFRQCKETGKFIPINEWRAKYDCEPQKGQAPTVFCNHFTPFKSAVTDKVITNKREHDYDLKSTGSRVFEGIQSEQREVDRFRARQEAELDRQRRETINQTYHEIEHGYRRLED